MGISFVIVLYFFEKHFHSNRGDCPPGLLNGGQINFEKSPDSLYIENQLTMSKNIVEECNYGPVDFCISRWIDSIGPNDVLNDSCYKAAHVIKNLIAGVNKLPALACSLPLDLLYEHRNQSHILSGLPGILSKHGIRKPLFYAYQFMEKSSQYLLDHSNDYMITTNGENNYCIICHNLKTLNYKYYLDDNPKRTFQNINEYMDNLDSQTFQFKLTNIENGDYLIKLRHINEDQGSVMNECIHMNCFSSKDLGRGELQYLDNYSHPGIRLENITVADHTLQFSTTLKPNEIKHIHIIYKF
jgi:beta-xylosidase